MKKAILLFLALALPALIFVFLKYAGKNEFTVPVFHKDGAMMTSECIPSIDTLFVPGTKPDSIRTESPYLIPKEVITALGMTKEVNVLVFPSAKLDFDKVKLAIEDEIGKNDIWFDRADIFFPDSNTLMKGRKCVFFVNDPSQSVLIDIDGQIRGYYDLSNRDEIDRLRIELKIVLKRY